MRMRDVLAAIAAVLSVPGVTQAGLCGVPSYNCCPTAACAPASCYTTCRVATQTCYRTVCETVYEPQEYTSSRTVYENSFEDLQETCYRTVTETAYREEAYTVNRPVTETAVRQETYCVQRPVVETLYQTRNYTVQRPVWEDHVRECRYTIQQPVCETIQQECRQTVMKCVTETIQQERCYTDLHDSMPSSSGLPPSLVPASCSATGALHCHGAAGGTSGMPGSGDPLRAGSCREDSSSSGDSHGCQRDRSEGSLSNMPDGM